MWYYLAKITLTALIIVVVSEIAKRHSMIAALIASLPLTSLMAFVWMKIEGIASVQIAELSQQIFWLILPSMVLFLVFPILIRYGISFWLSFGLASIATTFCYVLMLILLRRFGVSM
jgi:hypothetical protein